MTKKVAIALSKNHQVFLFVISPLSTNKMSSITNNLVEIKTRMWPPKTPVRVQFLLIRWFFLLLHMIRFLNYFLKCDIFIADGIYDHGSLLSIVCRLCSFLTRKRKRCVILTYGAFNVEKLEWCKTSRIPRIRLKFYNFLELLSIRYSDIILTADNRTLKYIYEKGGGQKVIYEPKFQVVDVTKFSFSPDIRKHYRKKLGIPDSDVVLLFVGKLIFLKGPDIALEVYRRIAKENKSVWLVYIGSSGDQEGTIKTSVLKENLKKVVFLGWIPYNVIHNYMMVGDIGLLPYRDQCGLGNVPLEMMSLRIPIIITDIGTLSYIIMDGENGFIASEKNIEKIVESAKYLIGDAVKREQIGQKAHKLVVENFSFDVFSSKINDTINRLTQGIL